VKSFSLPGKASVLLLLTLAGISLFLAGCTAKGENAGSAGGENDVLHLFNWNNYLAPDSVRRFEAACNCRLSQDYYSDNEEMLAKLAAGASGYDIIVPTGNALDTLLRQGVLRPLDKSLLPNLKNIDPAYLDTPFDPGNKYSVPYAFTARLQSGETEGTRPADRYLGAHFRAEVPGKNQGPRDRAR
jgi:spermidine/putrescine transport system substrate-binding protein